jgi:ABC-2 type transport system permease protein
LNVNVFLAVANMELRKLMSYRFDFWFNYFLSLVVRLGINYFVFKGIFQASGSELIGGFDFAGLNLYLALAFCGRKIVLNNADGFINDDIYTGGINRYLVQPVNLFGFKYAGHFAAGLLAIVQSAICLAVFAAVFGLQPFSNLSAKGALFAAFAFAVASLSYFFVAMAIDTIAFYADNIWSLHVMFRFFFEFAGGLLIPLSFFPTKIEAVLKLSPFYFMATFPIDCVFGKLSVIEMIRGLACSLVWCSFFYVLSKWAYVKGIKRYSGIGM